MSLLDCTVKIFFADTLKVSGLVLSCLGPRKKYRISVHVLRAHANMPSRLKLQLEFESETRLALNELMLYGQSTLHRPTVGHHSCVVNENMGVPSAAISIRPRICTEASIGVLMIFGEFDPRRKVFGKFGDHKTMFVVLVY